MRQSGVANGAGYLKTLAHGTAFIREPTVGQRIMFWVNLCCASRQRHNQYSS